MLAAAAVLAIVNVTWIDDGVFPNRTVVIRQGRIVSNKPGAPPKGARILDGTGKFLTYGFWDMHAHALAQWAENAPKLLAQGITGVRDMHVESADPLRNLHPPTGPRVFAAGPILDGPLPVWKASRAVGDALEARRAVAELKAAGVDFLKVYDLLPRDAYFALAGEARRRKIPFAGHIPIWVSVEEAVRAGQVSIEHLSGVFEACTADGRLENEMKQSANLWAISRAESARRMQSVHQRAAEAYDSHICEPLHRLFAEKGTWHCPTLVALEKVRAPALKAVGDMHRAGVKLLAGTDGKDGSLLHDELELLVRAGLTPLEALKTATTAPREFLRVDKNAADLVLLDANPLEDIRNTRRINAVILRGALQ